MRSGLLPAIAYCGVCGSPLQTTANNQRGKAIPLYRCAARITSKVTSKRPAIRRILLDDAVMENVFGYFADVQEAGDRSGENGMLTQLTEVNRPSTVAGQLALMPGANLKEVSGTLAKLGKQAEELEERITRERASSVRGSAADECAGTDGMTWTCQSSALAGGAPTGLAGLLEEPGHGPPTQGPGHPHGPSESDG